MAVEKIVLDTSVVSKWYLLGEHSDAALKLRNAHVSGKLTIAAPVLLLFKALNALRRGGVYSESELVKVAESLTDILPPLKGVGFPIRRRSSLHGASSHRVLRGLCQLQPLPWTYSPWPAFTALPAGASPSHLGLKPHTSLSNIHTTLSNPLKEASFRLTFNRIQPTSKERGLSALLW